MKKDICSVLLSLGVFAGILTADALAQQHVSGSPVVITVDASRRYQTIHNIGASGAWFLEGIGKYWPAAKKEKIAELLFSRAFDKEGNPKGIGLSAWRFYIGGGTAEQGDSSGIKDFRKRVECFLGADGKYDWDKQAGYQWFLRKAKQYGVENLIAFSNTPPVQFTQNGLGYKTVKDQNSNLKPDRYHDYADFLTTVAKHFDEQGLHFSYISPVNEPQWDWYYKFGDASQEGTPWTNKEIYKVIGALDSSLTAKGLQSKILTTEAGTLNFLYSERSLASRQIQHFFDRSSPLSFRAFAHVPNLICGHSYSSDMGDSLATAIRRNVADTAKKYAIEYWESEYCMLGDGFREGSAGKRSAMDCALFLAKIINLDLTAGNAAAWQFWNSCEPGSADFDTRYYLIALHPNAKHTDGDFTPVKNLWALGHYSRFVRPGMMRVKTEAGPSGNLPGRLYVSAFTDDKGKVVLVAVNYSESVQAIRLSLKNYKGRKSGRYYVTTAENGVNMEMHPITSLSDEMYLPARSVVTVVAGQ